MPDLERLKDYFAPDDLEWKPITVSKKTGKALAAAYITNRAIMERLDTVCGMDGWQNEFRPGPAGGVICGISIHTANGWVTKWDGAENTDIESVKGGISNAMKRAASQWGIGRYLYELPSQWVKVNQYGKFEHTPKVPSRFLPQGTKQAAPKPTPKPQESVGDRIYRGLMEADAGKYEKLLQQTRRAVAKMPEDQQTEAHEAIAQAEKNRAEMTEATYA